jgi:hypothetical protein
MTIAITPKKEKRKKKKKKITPNSNSMLGGANLERFTPRKLTNIKKS